MFQVQFNAPEAIQKSFHIFTSSPTICSLCKREVYNGYQITLNFQMKMLCAKCKDLLDPPLLYIIDYDDETLYNLVVGKKENFKNIEAFFKCGWLLRFKKTFSYKKAHTIQDPLNFYVLEYHGEKKCNRLLGHSFFKQEEWCKNTACSLFTMSDSAWRHYKI